MRPTKNHSTRRGVAAVELAFLMPLLLGLIVGVWEVGRLVHVQQIMNAAARDGARLASQAYIVNTTGSNTQIDMTTTNPNVHDTVAKYLQGAGITNLTGLQVNFVFITGDTTLTQPYQGIKNQRFRLTVTLPYSNVTWTNLSLVNPTTVGGECVWQMMTDDPLSVSTTLPGWSP
jgi:Flp pilus assembly protein TadG